MDIFISIISSNITPWEHEIFKEKKAARPSRTRREESFRPVPGAPGLIRQERAGS
jgi:hypothetical protein